MDEAFAKHYIVKFCLTHLASYLTRKEKANQHMFLINKRQMSLYQHSCAKNIYVFFFSFNRSNFS